MLPTTGTLIAGLGPRPGSAEEWLCCLFPVMLVFFGPLVFFFLLAFIYRRRPKKADEPDNQTNPDQP